MIDDTPSDMGPSRQNNNRSNLSNSVKNTESNSNDLSRIPMKRRPSDRSGGGDKRARNVSDRLKLPTPEQRDPQYPSGPYLHDERPEGALRQIDHVIQI